MRLVYIRPAKDGVSGYYRHFPKPYSRRVARPTIVAVAEFWDEIETGKKVEPERIISIRNMPKNLTLNA